MPVDSPAVNYTDLCRAVAAIQLRVEGIEDFTALFADANVFPTLIPLKHQVVRGRRGTGKTHLLGRLKEHYWSSFKQDRVLPIYVDGTTIAKLAIIGEPSPVLYLLVWYKRLLDGLLNELETFMRDDIIVGRAQRFFGGPDKDRQDRAFKGIAKLKQLVREFDHELTGGKGEFTQRETESASKGTTLKLGAEAEGGASVTAPTGLTPGAKAALTFGAKLDRVTSENAETVVKKVYETLAVMNYPAISEALDELLKDLQVKAVALLLDEWSEFDLSPQPLFAEMLRATLLSGPRIFLKLACIPFLTHLSTTRSDGQTTGLSLGEDIFADVDLDRLFNPYTDTQGVTGFMTRVLQKHLAPELPALGRLQLPAWWGLLIPGLVGDAECLGELIYASAGVPRDFLRIFVKSVQASKELPISSKAVREATHDYFQVEKSDLLRERPKTRQLLDNIFEGTCLPAGSWAFFVSERFRDEERLRELWHHRLIHILYEGYLAWAKNKPGTFDIYVLDYGRYVTMRASRKGEEVYAKNRRIISVVLKTLGRTQLLGLSGNALLGLNEVLDYPAVEDRVRQYFDRAAAAELDITPVELEKMASDCSALVIDRWLMDGSTATSEPTASPRGTRRNK